jgi:pilus assembly protein Flp/PilA
MMIKLNKLARNSKGATAIEYGLIAALIAVAGISAFGAVGNGVKKTFGTATTELNK